MGIRNIEFRGKRKDNGEWVQGDSLIHSMYKKGDVCVGVVEGLGIYGVIPETVGQYTGLTDKNGKKIFEGDIVKIKGKTRYIFYGSSSFRHTNYGEYAAELTNVNTDRDCEVIGNIYDNPEIIRR